MEGKNKKKQKNVLKVSSEISDFKNFKKKKNVCKSGLLQHLLRKIKQAISFLSAGHLNYFCSHEYWSRLLHPPFRWWHKRKTNDVRWVSATITWWQSTLIWIYESNLGMVTVGSPVYHLRPSHLQHAFFLFPFGHKMPSEVHWKLNLISFGVGCW